MSAYFPLLPLVSLLVGVGLVGAFALGTRFRAAPRVAPPTAPGPHQHRSYPRRRPHPDQPAIDVLLAQAARHPQTAPRHRLNEDVETRVMPAVVIPHQPAPTPTAVAIAALAQA